MTFKSLQYFQRFCRNFRIFLSINTTKINKKKEDYYNNVYTYSGDYEIGDYEFLGDKGIVAKWVSKDRKKINKFVSTLRTIHKVKLNIITMMLSWQVNVLSLENFKTMSRKKRWKYLSFINL